MNEINDLAMDDAVNQIAGTPPKNEAEFWVGMSAKEGEYPEDNEKSDERQEGLGMLEEPKGCTSVGGDGEKGGGEVFGSLIKNHNGKGEKKNMAAFHS